LYFSLSLCAMAFPVGGATLGVAPGPPLRSIQNLSALRADAHLLPFRLDGVPDARRAAVAAHQRHVRNVDRTFFLENPAANLFGGIRPDVPLDHVHAFDKEH